MSATTRRGKIARLPLAVREELNRRLLENQPAKTICAWVNAQPETAAVCREFGDGKAIDDRNVSDWRHGGYADWLRRRESIEDTRELAAWSVKLAKASGGQISEGAAAILAGQILELLEGLSRLKEVSGAEAPAQALEMAKAVDELTTALARLRSGDHERVRLDQNRQRLEQQQQELVLLQQRFHRDTARLFLEWRANAKAVEIADGAGTNVDKIEALGQLMFGDDWRPADGETSI